jgi:hypothetical protein
MEAKLVEALELDRYSKFNYWKPDSDIEWGGLVRTYALAIQRETGEDEDAIVARMREELKPKWDGDPAITQQRHEEFLRTQERKQREDWLFRERYVKYRDSLESDEQETKSTNDEM